MILSNDTKSRGYVFLTVPKMRDCDYQEYRELRTELLLAYCHGMKVRYGHLQEVIGIASEPFSEAAASQDFLYVDLTAELSPEECTLWEEVMEELDIMQAPANEVQYFGGMRHEFPMPFNFGSEVFQEYGAGVPMNRAERRRMEKEARKATKQKR